MSWNLGPVQVFFDSVEADLKDVEPVGQDINLPHVAEAISAVKDAAAAILRSGAVGWGHATVQAYGHANKDHRPDPPWVDDAINILIHQVHPE